MLMMFGGKHVDFSGGGAMGGLCMGIVANKLWSSGWAPGGKVGRLSIGKDDHFAHEVEGDLAVAWKSLFQPLLFGVIGSAIKFANLSAATIPRSIMLIVIGLCIRLPAAFAACSFGALDFKEKLFIALSWVPKATVQAALASDPLETIMESKTGEPDFDKWQQWGNEILTTAVFSIILTAPLGMMIINVLGPRWLSRDVDPDAEAAGALAIVYGDDLKGGGDHDHDVARTSFAGANGEHQVLWAAQDHVASASASGLPPRLYHPSSPSRSSLDGVSRLRTSMVSDDSGGGGGGGDHVVHMKQRRMSFHATDQVPIPGVPLPARARMARRSVGSIAVGGALDNAGQSRRRAR